MRVPLGGIVVFCDKAAANMNKVERTRIVSCRAMNINFHSTCNLIGLATVFPDFSHVFPTKLRIIIQEKYLIQYWSIQVELKICLCV